MEPVVTFLAIFTGAFFATASGFGYALIATPVLSLFMPVKGAVALILFTTIILRMFTMLRVKGVFETKTVLTVSMGSVIGSLPGGLTLKYIGPEALEIFLGVILLVATWLMHRDCYLPVANKNVWRLGAGFLSGFFGAATSVSGPPIILYFLNEGMEKEIMRANMIWIFGITGITMLAANYLIGNMEFLEDWSLMLYAVPAVFAGIFVGEWAFKRLSQRVFRNFAMGIVCCGAALMLFNGLKRLL